VDLISSRYLRVLQRHFHSTHFLGQLLIMDVGTTNTRHRDESLQETIWRTYIHILNSPSGSSPPIVRDLPGPQRDGQPEISSSHSRTLKNCSSYYLIACTDLQIGNHILSPIRAELLLLMASVAFRHHTCLSPTMYLEAAAQGLTASAESLPERQEDC
jgi:hypothetical protein